MKIAELRKHSLERFVVWMGFHLAMDDQLLSREDQAIIVSYIKLFLKEEEESQDD